MLNTKSANIVLALIFPILLLPQVVHVDSARAEDCSNKTCIDVYAQDGQIVIEARKGSTPHAAKRMKPKVIPHRSTKPAVKPTIKSTAPRKFVPRKTVVRKQVRKVAPVISLADKLIKLIPSGNISHEPGQDALVNVPMIYWCDLPSVFSTKVAILGETVDVVMRPSFMWSFGDGSFYATTSPGASYPDQSVMHAYKKAGTYAVVLVSTWGGTWTNNGVARAITGQVRKVSATVVSVGNAPTRLTQ